MTDVRKRSVSIRGHRTSFSLEAPFLEELAAIARRREVAVAALIAEVDEARPRTGNLSSALRVFVLEDLRARAARGDPAARTSIDRPRVP